MPSIFNHENSCWGVKRTSYDDVFQYNFNEDIGLHHRKQTDILEVGVVTKHNSDTSTSANNKYPSVQYSVSSNCYYGYQPHGSVCKPIIDDEMEVEDSSSPSESNLSLSNDYESRLGVGNDYNLKNFTTSTDKCENNTVFDITSQAGYRKRHIPTNDDPCTKKMRKEDSGGGETGLSQQWRVNLHDSIGANENTTELLRQTHGCELYHYGREDDY